MDTPIPDPIEFEVDVPGGYTQGGKPLQSLLGRDLQEYYKTRARAKRFAKQALIAGLADDTATLAHRDEARTVFAEGLIGWAPGVRPALNPVVTGTVVRTGYRIEKVYFESLPGHFATANLYVPDGVDGVTPAPGILVLCGHDTDGKVGYQTFAQGLCKGGHVVLIMDPIGQGERLQVPSTAPVDEHRKVGANMTLTGWSLPGLMAWDASRAIDYMLSREEVDPDHIGVTGTSGGGTQTMLVCAIDPRITMAAPSCSVTSQLANIENELYADHEQIPLDSHGAGLDMDDMLLCIAGLGTGAVLIVEQRGTASLTGDYFDWEDTDEIHGRLVAYHTLIGNDPAVFARVFKDTNGHQLDQDGMREILRFFNSLTGGDANAAWPSTTPETTLTLQVTPTGSVLALGGALSLRSLNIARADAAAIARGTPTGATLRLRMREVLRMEDYDGAAGDLTDETKRATPPDASAFQFEDQWSRLGAGSVPAISEPNYPRPYGSRYHVETEPVVIQTIGGTPRVIHPAIRAALYFLTGSPWVSQLPIVPEDTPAFLYVSHLSTDREFSKNEREALVTTMFAANPTAAWFGVDLRGTGESQPNVNMQYAALTTGAGSNDDHWARVAESFNEPHLGRRVWDLLRVIDLLASRGWTDIRLVARGWGCNAATHGAILDDRVTSITLKNALTRWTAVARAKPGEISWGMGDLPRRVLDYYDLPDLYAELFTTKGLARAFNAEHGQNEYGESPWGAWGAQAAGEF